MLFLFYVKDNKMKIKKCTNNPRNDEVPNNWSEYKNLPIYYKIINILGFYFSSKFTKSSKISKLINIKRIIKLNKKIIKNLF